MTLEAADISALVAGVLERSIEGAEPVRSGLIHDTWTVTCNGEAFIVQLAAEDADHVDGLTRTVTSYHLAAQSAVPVPAVVSDGVESATVKGDRYHLYVAERLPGTSLDRQSTPELDAMAVSYLPTIHSLRSFDSPGWLIPDDDDLVVTGFDAEGWSGMVRKKFSENLAQLQEQLPPKTMEQASKIRSSHLHRVPVEFEPRFCHNDFSPDNVLAEAGTVTGVLDFDFVIAGHAARDLVKTANSFHLVNGTDRELVYNAYDDQESLPAGFRTWEPVYRITTMMEIVASWFELATSVPDQREEHLVENVQGTVAQAVGELEESQAST